MGWSTFANSHLRCTSSVPELVIQFSKTECSRKKKMNDVSDGPSFGMGKLDKD
jgi:hypothetical protein